jgi:putative ABC transport system permease protein
VPPLIQSLHHAARRLAGARGLSIAAVLTLALGLAATTTVFTLVNAVLLRPLPYPAPEQLVSLSHTLVVGGDLRVDQSDASILFYSRHHRAFSHFGGYQVTAAGVGPANGSDAERVPAGRVTAELFPTLAVVPLRGRLFSESDDRPGAAPVVVLSERLWRRKYGGDPGILNRILDIDRVPHEVIGILPARFRFPEPDTELWLPLRLDPAKTETSTFEHQAIARLRDGVSIDEAAADLQALLERLPDEFPGRLTRQSIGATHMRVSVRPLAAVVVGDVGRVLWVVLGAAGFVLAIACANVANLFLVHAEGRSNAIALKRALGATRADILVDFLSESLLVSALAGVLGALAAGASVGALRALGGVVDIPRLSELSLDGAVLGVAALLTMVTALFLSVIPALRSRTWSIAGVSGMGSRAASAGRARQALVVAQVAFALILLVGSGLMARSMWRLLSVEPGFEPSNVMTFRLALPTVSYPGSDDSVRFYVRATEAIAGVPGVSAAGAVSKLPLDEQGRTDSAVFIEDQPLPPGSLPGIHSVLYATPGYFEGAGIPFLQGRNFTRPAPPRVDLEAVVSRAFAERYWANESPLGKRVRIYSANGPWYTVVGMVGNVRDKALDQAEDAVLYCPLLPAREDPRWTPRDIAFVARTAGDPTVRAGAIRDAVRGLDPSLPIYRIRALDEIVERASARRWLTFLLVAGASAAALFLGAIGLYGVMSYVVTLRTREMGIRLAIGAAPDEVRFMVLRQGLAVAALGIAVGLAGAMLLTRFLAALLFEVSPTDPAVLALAAAVLLIVAGTASWLPARRAAVIDLARTLRTE